MFCFSFIDNLFNISSCCSSCYFCLIDFFSFCFLLIVKSLLYEAVGLHTNDACPLIVVRINTLCLFNPLTTNFPKWSNTLKQFVGNLPTNCFSVFDRFVGLALKGLIGHLEHQMSRQLTSVVFWSLGHNFQYQIPDVFVNYFWFVYLYVFDYE